MRVFLNKMTLLLLSVCVFFAENAHVVFADKLTQMEAYFTQPEGYSGWMEVPGRGSMRYYAQNDPLWSGLTYERGDTTTWRPFRDSGCGPAAGAMAVANLLTDGEFSIIAAYAKQPYSLCSCSVNRARCSKSHARYILTSERDFQRFLPLVFGDYATGNNIKGSYSRSGAVGTSTGFLWEIADIYGLTLSTTNSYQEALQALQDGKQVVALAGAGGAFTDSGHYVLLAHVDDEKLFILDPLARTEYKTTNGKKIEILQPGLVALTHANVKFAQFHSFIVFDRPL